MTYEELTRLLQLQQPGYQGPYRPISYGEIIQAIQSQYEPVIIPEFNQPYQVKQVGEFKSGASQYIDGDQIFSQPKLVEYGRSKEATKTYTPGAFDIEKFTYKPSITVGDVIDTISSGGGSSDSGPSGSTTSPGSGISVSPSQAMSVVSAISNSNPTALAIAIANIAMSNSGSSGGDSTASDASNATGVAGIGASDAAAATGASSSVGEGAVGGSVGGEGAVGAGDGSSSGVGDGGAAGAAGGDGGGGGGGGGKIICTAMNHAYGFGAYRNAIWITYANKNLTKAHEVGYHTLFLPLVKFAFHSEDGKLNKIVRKILEHGTRRRTKDLRAEMRGTKRDPLGRFYRAIFEPICYLTGKIKGY